MFLEATDLHDVTNQCVWQVLQKVNRISFHKYETLNIQLKFWYAEITESLNGSDMLFEKVKTSLMAVQCVL